MRREFPSKLSYIQYADRLSIRLALTFSSFGILTLGSDQRGELSKSIFEFDLVTDLDPVIPVFQGSEVVDQRLRPLGVCSERLLDETLAGLHRQRLGGQRPLEGTAVELNQALNLNCVGNHLIPDLHVLQHPGKAITRVIIKLIREDE